MKPWLGRPCLNTNGPLSVEEHGSWNSPEIEWNNRPWFPQCYELSSQHPDCALRVKRNGVPWAAAHMPNTSPVNAKRILKQCKERCHWTVDNWKRVIWSDESCCTMLQSDGRVWVWQMSGGRYLPAYVVPTVKFRGGGITLWGCFPRSGLGSLIILHENLNTEGYKDILTHCILSAAEAQFGDDSYLYQHDSAPCHKSRSMREWFVDNTVPEMGWPAHSPDWNPTLTLPHTTNCSGCSSTGSW
jgi:hypothetical protein